MRYLIFFLAFLYAVPTVKVEKRNITNHKIYYATASLDDSSVYSYSLRFSGYVTDIFADRIYMKVKKGDRLFSIYSKDIAQAQSELLGSIKFDKDVKSSIKKLLLLGVDKKNIDTIMASKSILDDVVMYSNFDGYVFAKSINNGSYIKEGQEVYRIANLDKLFVLVKVNQEDINHIKSLSKAVVRFSGLNQDIDMKLDLVYPNIDPADKFITIRFILNNAKSLVMPNMFGKAMLQFETRNVLYLPLSSVLVKNNKTIVFRKNELDEFEPVTISAIRSQDGYEILSGLSEGDEVVQDSLFIIDADVQK